MSLEIIVRSITERLIKAASSTVSVSLKEGETALLMQNGWFDEGDA